MLSKVTSLSFMLIVFNGFSCCSRCHFNSCTCQAVSKTRHSALDCLGRTEYRENIETEPKTLQIRTIRKLYVRLTVLDFLAALRVLKHKIRGLKPPATSLVSLIFTVDFCPGTKSTQPVTSQGCFGRAQNGRQFSSQPANFERLKSRFRKPLAKKKLIALVSKVETKISGKKISFR